MHQGNRAVDGLHQPKSTSTETQGGEKGWQPFPTKRPSEAKEESPQETPQTAHRVSASDNLDCALTAKPETARCCKLCRSDGRTYAILVTASVQFSIIVETFSGLEQRISFRYSVPPMTSKETRGYIPCHLKLTVRTDTIFSE